MKHIVVVDDDVDVYNETEVLWAIATRVQADEDVFIIPGCRGSDLDPSAKEQGIITKVGIDATRTLLRPFPSRLKIPESHEQNKTGRLLEVEQKKRKGKLRLIRIR